MWVYKPSPPRFNATEKSKLITKVKEMLSTHTKVSKKVSRIEMRSNRIYLYELVEQFNPEGAVYEKPLIEGKYMEYPYARITLLDKQGDNCTADFRRHTGEWITLYTGTLAECIESIENDNAWFQ